MNFKVSLLLFLLFVMIGHSALPHNHHTHRSDFDIEHSSSQAHHHHHDNQNAEHHDHHSNDLGLDLEHGNHDSNYQSIGVKDVKIKSVLPVCILPKRFEIINDFLDQGNSNSQDFQAYLLYREIVYEDPILVLHSLRGPPVFV
jgi:hypothetical protein